MGIFTACDPDNNQEFPGNGTVTGLFLTGIPEDYAAFKEPLASMVAMRESALAQELGKAEINLGFRKITYLYPSCGVTGDSITLSAVAFWLGYFDNGVWNDLKPENICRWSTTPSQVMQKLQATHSPLRCSSQATPHHHARLHWLRHNQGEASSIP